MQFQVLHPPPTCHHRMHHPQIPGAVWFHLPQSPRSCLSFSSRHGRISQHRERELRGRGYGFGQKDLLQLGEGMRVGGSCLFELGKHWRGRGVKVKVVNMTDDDVGCGVG
jgi:hypothetical protein